MKKKLFTLAMFCLAALCFSLTSYAQPTSFVDHFNGTHQGNWGTNPNATKVVIDYSSGTDLYVKGVQNQVFGGLILGFWPQDWGIRIKASPYMKFKAKSASGNRAQLLGFNGSYTDGSLFSFQKTVNMTTAYEQFSLDLTSAFATAEAGGKTVRNIYEIMWFLNAPVAAPADDPGFYVDDVMLGDSANPCTTVRPSFTLSPSSASLNFNATTPAIINLSGITDGNGGTKAPITITAKSSDTTVLVPTVIYNSPDATGSVSLKGANPPKAGSPITITITVKDTAYCNNSTSKTLTAAVKPEILNFSISSTNLNNIAADGVEKTVNILNITNAGGSTPVDNYHGLSMSAQVTSGSTLLSSFSDVIEIDTTAGTAVFKYTPTGAGKITVALKLSSTYGAAAKIVNLTINTTAVSLTDAATARLEVYPNPASDVINVLLPEGAEKVEVIDMYGITAKSISVKGQSGTINISVNDLARGTYIISTGKAKAEVIIK